MINPVRNSTSCFPYLDDINKKEHILNKMLRFLFYCNILIRCDTGEVILI